MKATRKLIPAIALLLVSVITMASASYAWFSMNAQVTATGMNVKATASSNLVIGTGLIPVGATATTVQVTNTTATSLIPMKWNDTSWAIATGTIDPATGSPAATTTALTLTAENKSSYFIDYLIYIASSGAAMSNQTIKATVSTTSTEMYSKAASVAFYYNTANAEINATPDVTANVANNGTSGSAVTIKTGATVPSCQSAPAGTAIIMRVYFDGSVSGTENTYTACASNAVAVEGATYYTLANGVYSEASVALGSTVSGYYTQNPNATVAYINSANIPLNASTLNVTITSTSGS